MFDISKFKTEDGYLIPSGIHYVTEPVKLTGKNIRICGEDGAILRALRHKLW